MKTTGAFRSSPPPATWWSACSRWPARVLATWSRTSARATGASSSPPHASTARVGSASSWTPAAAAYRPGRRADRRLLPGDGGDRLPAPQPHRQARAALPERAEARDAHRVAFLSHGELAPRPHRDDARHAAPSGPGRREHALPVGRSRRCARSIVGEDGIVLTRER